MREQLSGAKTLPEAPPAPLPRTRRGPDIDEESGLVAVIFGAWLMQENDLHEKQIILLTGNDSEREAQIEQQLRELTLLPLNIKHMSVKAFLQTGAPRGAALIIAPYTMPLPLFSPPLIYTDLTLTTHQQEQIRKMLESA